MKSKENARMSKESFEIRKRNAHAKYSKMLREAEESDAAELARYEADLAKAKKEKETRLSSVIKECSTALAKHKANFKEIQVISDELLREDMKIVDTLISIIGSGKANSIDDAIEVYKSEKAGALGEIYVYVGIRRREGSTSIRNIVYIDGVKNTSAEMPYSVIKVPEGKHTVSAKVQLNYNGATHYPSSEVISLDIKGGEKKYVKFYIKGSPKVQHVICSSEEELISEL